MKIKAILLCSVAATLGACHSSNPDYVGSGARYTPRAEITQKNYTVKNRVEDRIDKKSYESSEQREQCQYYRELPRHMADKCVKPEDGMELTMVQISSQTRQNDILLPIVSSYTILFDHDHFDVRSNQMRTIDKAMREIEEYNPTQVTVTGYTDSSGKADYNQSLSHKREQVVSKLLLERGIGNETIAREARGEFSQAVITEDGVRNQQNRRVVIDFRR
jgi:outer membrane protein OmpA-like peptidoglycan-associated protein